MLPLVVNTPTDLPPVCANAESVTLPAAWVAEHEMAMAYQSEQWTEHYRHARNAMEGKNRYLKNGLSADIASADQRRYRGCAKQLLAIVVKIVAANIATVAAWLDARDRGDHDPEPNKGGRPKSSGLEDYEPRRKDIIRIIGPPARKDDITA